MLDLAKADASVRDVVRLLALGDYGAVARLSSGRIAAEEVRQAVDRYGGTILAEPFEMRSPMVLESGGGWWTDVDLHTEGEGRSDLTLCLTLLDASGPRYSVQVDDLRVL